MLRFVGFRHHEAVADDLAALEGGSVLLLLGLPDGLADRGLIALSLLKLTLGFPDSTRMSMKLGCLLLMCSLHGHFLSTIPR